MAVPGCWRESKAAIKFFPFPEPTLSLIRRLNPIAESTVDPTVGASPASEIPPPTSTTRLPRTSKSNKYSSS